MTPKVATLRDGEWLPVVSMGVARAAACAAVLGGDDDGDGGTMYIMGGNEGCRRLASVECWAFGATAWTAAPSMSAARAGACAVGCI